MKPLQDLVCWYLKRKNLHTVPANAAATFPTALERLRNRSITLGSIIDVGASDGRWTAQVLPFYPRARYLCIEAHPAHQQALSAFSANHPEVEYAICAAGEQEGQAWFLQTEDLLGGAVQQSPHGNNCMTVPSSTVDLLVGKHKLPPPFLLKLDTHGYELPILAGAARTLEKTEVLIVEVYNFPAAAPAVPFYEFCRLMAECGFRCIDLFDPLYRSHDNAFWQMDLVFLRDSRPEFQYPFYA